MSNIVVVSTEPPDPFGNAAGRWYYVLARGLAERGHGVRWFAAYTSEDSAANARRHFNASDVNLHLYPYPTRSYWESKWKALQRPYSYFISDSLLSDLSETLESGYDVLHLEQTWAAWLGMDRPRTLLSVHWLARVDLANGAPSSVRHGIARTLIKNTERRLLRSSPWIRVLTSQDKEVVQRISPGARIGTVPLAVDSTLYPFHYTEPSDPTVGLIGSMGWQPTRAAAIRLVTRIWPRVKAAVKNAKLLVVGWDAKSALARYLDWSDVTVLQDVPNASPYFHALSVMLFPLVRGSGMKVKVLEAMAYGVPVVTTPEGVAGMAVSDGEHAAVAEDDETLAQRTICLLRDYDAHHSMSLAARRLIEERHSSRAVIPQIEALYEQASSSW